MTEQPPSAASLWTDLLEKDDRTSPEEYPDMALITFEEFQYLLDHYAAQRVAAETERWQNRDRQRLEQISTLQEAVQGFQSAQAERPAPGGPNPFRASLLARMQEIEGQQPASTYQAGVSDARGRLQEPDVREAVRAAVTAEYVESEDLLKIADAALTKIDEMLK